MNYQIYFSIIVITQTDWPKKCATLFISKETECFLDWVSIKVAKNLRHLAAKIKV